jgi:hypothetical protein
MRLPLITWLLQNVFLDILNHPLISGLKLDKQILLFVSVFSDADWTGDIDDRRSTGGFVCILGIKPYIVEC